MAKGPIPNPPKLRLLRGEQQKRKIEAEIQVPAAQVDPPDHLSPGAVAIWNDLAPELAVAGLLTVLDRDVLGVFCEELSAYRVAIKTTRSKKTTKNTRGGRQPHPAVRRAKDAAAMVRQLAADLGLTPASRRRLIGLLKADELSDDDAFRFRLGRH